MSTSPSTYRAVIPTVLVILLLALIGYGYFEYRKKEIANISSFEECAQAGYPVMESYPPQCRTPDGRVFTYVLSEGYVWETSTDSSLGLSFQYPKELKTKYIHLFDWPPRAAVLAGPFTCTEAGSEYDRAGGTERRVFDGRVYCLTKETEGAAGSVYTQYAVVVPAGTSVVSLTFSIRSVQCANYDEPSKTECAVERNTFDMMPIIDRMAATVTLTPSGDRQGSGISGIVLLGPTCPVERFPPDPACADKPYATRLALTTVDGARVITEFSSSADGRFTVSVSPGEYTIRSAALADILPRCSTSGVVPVRPGSYASTTVYCDTGIR